MESIYRAIFVVALVLAILCLIASVLIFFLLKIKDVIGDLSGATAKKAIEDIRSGNAPAAPKKKTKSTTASSVGITGSTAQTERMTVQEQFDNLEASEGHDPYDNFAAETSVLVPLDSETTVLSASDAPADSTAGPTEITELPHPKSVEGFNVLVDITYVHSHEVIK